MDRGPRPHGDKVLLLKSSIHFQPQKRQKEKQFQRFWRVVPRRTTTSRDPTWKVDNRFSHSGRRRSGEAGGEGSGGSGLEPRPFTFHPVFFWHKDDGDPSWRTARRIDNQHDSRCYDRRAAARLGVEVVCVTGIYIPHWHTAEWWAGLSLLSCFFIYLFILKDEAAFYLQRRKHKGTRTRTRTRTE